MSWICDGKPKDGNSYPGTKGPHPAQTWEDGVQKCYKCGLPKSAVVIPVTTQSSGTDSSTISSSGSDTSEQGNGNGNGLKPLSLVLVGGLVVCASVAAIVYYIVSREKCPVNPDLGSEACWSAALEAVEQEKQALEEDLNQVVQLGTAEVLAAAIDTAHTLDEHLNYLGDPTTFTDKQQSTFSKLFPEDSVADFLALEAVASWISQQDPQGDPTSFIKLLLTEPLKVKETDLTDDEKNDLLRSWFKDPEKLPPTKAIACSEADRYSFGEQVLFTGLGNPDLIAGAEQFKDGNYSEALARFKTVTQSTPNNPEPQIYYQNAQARLKSDTPPYQIAAVVPVKNREDSALDILRGIADAQREFNEQQGDSRPLLEVQIVNDDNSAAIGKCVAEELSKNDEILAVIGHNSSKVTQSALPVYEKGGLALISPSSTSTELKGSNFFRTIASDAISGKALADYVTKNFTGTPIALLNVVGDTYSESLQTEFSRNLDTEKFPLTLIDLSSDASSNLDSVIDEIEKSQAQVVVLFPNTDYITRAIGILRSLAENPDTKDIQVIGGDALYTSQVLVEGGSGIEGVILAAPMPLTEDYLEKTNEQWLGQVNWRTAASYDAALAITSVLSSTSERSGIIEALENSVDLDASKTSGLPLDFSGGQRDIEKSSLVQACPKVPSPAGARFGFAPLEVCLSQTKPNPSPATASPPTPAKTSSPNTVSQPASPIRQPTQPTPTPRPSTPRPSTPRPSTPRPSTPTPNEPYIPPVPEGTETQMPVPGFP